ncbi:membrane protein, putative [Caulobacter vibrioides CB15]|uniref:Membrane protein, putative n=2 Tax=Caulobacter vibrioides TaxID=155892 RepID=Q9AA92_CAUVC|nr:membrane protein, putative [Caulobacter vibrioides CB15]ATC27555.1 DUF418 domain-containing protein [Caulobacter vibrioides]
MILGPVYRVWMAASEPDRQALGGDAMTDTTAPMTEALRPVAKADRHLSLDVLRGLGVMGILAVNAVAFGLPMPVYMSPELSPFGLAGAEASAWWVVQTFFHYKFITLFSILFGVSILLVGGERTDKARGALLRRRLGWLLVIGLLHGLLIWFGDILLLYACTGFVALLARSWTPRRLFTVSLTILLLGSALAIAPLFLLESAPAELQQKIIAEMNQPGSGVDVAAATAAMRGGLVAALGENFKSWMILQPMSVIVFIWRTGALMLLGMALFKTGFLTGKAKTWVYLLLIALGGAGLAWTGWESSMKLATDFAEPQATGRYNMAYEFASLPITLGYASLAILLIRSRAIAGLLNPVARLGQMAFTNYLTQSLIMTTIFWSGRGLGLFGEFNRVELWGCVIAIWALQLIWSPLWLSRFSMGPMEWIWRRLAYGKGLARGA